MLDPRTNPVTPMADALDQCVAGLAVLDVEFRFERANPALLEIAGTRRLIGESLALLDAAPPQLSTAAERASAGRYPVMLRSARLHGGAHGEFVADVALSPLDGGRLLLEVHALAAPAETVGARLSESLRGFAHEVKNPLAGVRGAAQLLRRRMTVPDLAELAELIMTEADRLAALADRLLRSGVKPRLVRLNVHETIERVAALMAAEQPALRIVRDYDPSLPALAGDADRLQQLLLNLTRNAVEAGAATLILRSRAEHGVRVGERLQRLAARIDVQDDGHGVPATIADTLFQPLVSGRSDGTGLGLALAQEIAREHGGELRHSGRPGATVFSLLLPLGDAHG